MIIIHYTGTANAEEAAAIYLGSAHDPKAGRISPHYMIERDGKVTQFVADHKRAWHAGRSYWRGSRDINALSIGIELVNPGHEHDYLGFPDAQIDALAALCAPLTARFDIAPNMVLGHADVAPGRKNDPGEKFPWRTLAEKGIGFWPGDNAPPVKDVHAALLEIGYDPDAPADALINAFQQHYVPEVFTGAVNGGEADDLMRVRLGGLLYRYSYSH
jgi:N-acetylmuramoyl-L-alanine amidase